MSFSGFRVAALLFAALFLNGCATVARPNPDDPWEGFNRGVYSFNETLDDWVIKPVAQGYDAVAPTPVRFGVHNFVENLNDPWIGANNLLQGKWLDGLSDLGRFVVNTTMGVVGLIDVATPMGLERHQEDFGQTMAVWGVGSGPYVVLPFFGPRTVRDSVGLIPDLYADPLINIEDTYWGVLFARVIDRRVELLPAEKLLDTAALDRYDYLRSAYLQRRRSLILDGNMPQQEIPEE